MKSNADWKGWGRIDPLYGVATIPGRAKHNPESWNEEDFHELGLRDWAAFRPKWERYGVSTENCLEIGCGVGRMTRHLASYFSTVHATDVSAEMIEHAKQRLKPTNICFHLTDGIGIPLPDKSIRAVFSTHVFQHFDCVEDGAACFREIQRVMEPGGTVMIHLPIVMWPWGAMARVHNWIEHYRSSATGMAVRLRRLAWALKLRRRPAMRVIWYEVNWVHQTLEEFGFGDIEITLLFGNSNMAVQHPFVFARKVLRVPVYLDTFSQ